jgi:RNA polymerase sigma factor (sigma-70 family)
MQHPSTDYFYQLMAEAASRGADDAALLARFVASRDEEAFAELVRRYGPSVFGICRRILGDRHAAEDAFQATFLALTRRAGTITRPDAVGGWLCSTAFRFALKARQRERQCRVREQRAARMEATADTARDWNDIEPLVFEELERLPEKYRGPLMVCGVLGKPLAVASRELGVPTPTVWHRLQRGRKILRQQLEGRGVMIPAAGLVALLLSVRPGAAAVPPALLASTLAIVSRGAGLLVPWVLKACAATVLVAACGTLAVAVWSWCAPRNERPPEWLETAATAAPAPAPVGPRLTGTVVDAAGRPIADAEVAVFARPPRDPEDFPMPDRLLLTGKAGSDGKFSLRLPAGAKTDRFRLLAAAEKVGFATLTIEAKDDPGDVSVRLTPSASVKGVVQSEQGKPLAGARVRVWWVGEVWAAAPSQETAADPVPPVRFWPSPVVTGVDGAFEFPGLTGAKWAVIEVVHPNFARADVPWRPGQKLGPTGDVIRLTQSKEVVGRVTAAKTGAPIAGARVGHPTRISVPNSPAGLICVIEKTDAQGAYRLVPRRVEMLPIVVVPPVGSGFASEGKEANLDGATRAVVDVTLPLLPMATHRDSK